MKKIKVCSGTCWVGDFWSPTVTELGKSGKFFQSGYMRNPRKSSQTNALPYHLFVCPFHVFNSSVKKTDEDFPKLKFTGTWYITTRCNNNVNILAWLEELWQSSSHVDETRPEGPFQDGSAHFSSSQLQFREHSPEICSTLLVLSHQDQTWQKVKHLIPMCRLRSGVSLECLISCRLPTPTVCVQFLDSISCILSLPGDPCSCTSFSSE